MRLIHHFINWGLGSARHVVGTPQLSPTTMPSGAWLSPGLNVICPRCHARGGAAWESEHAAGCALCGATMGFKVSSPQEDYRPWAFDRLDERGVHVQRDGKTVLITYGMMLAALNGLKSPATIDEFYEPRHREGARQGFEAAEHWLTVQAMMWT